VAPRRILITGANRGLGLAVARRLAMQGHELMITARNEAKARSAVGTILEDHPDASVESSVLDLSSLDSVRQVGGALVARDRLFDVVVHNAGMLFPSQERALTDSDVEESLQVHAVAPLLLTRLLMPVMARPSRVWIVGSSLHYPGSRGPDVDFRFDDPNLDTRYIPERAYKNGKLAALWVAYELERRLADAGIHADVVSPGFVPKTAAAGVQGWLRRAALEHVLSRMPFARSVDDSSAGMATLFTETPLDEPGGRYFKDWKPVPSSEQSRDNEQAKRFWCWACERADLPIEV